MNKSASNFRSNPLIAQCELSAKNTLGLNKYRVFNAEGAETQRTQRKTQETLRPLRPLRPPCL